MKTPTKAELHRLAVRALGESDCVREEYCPACQRGHLYLVWWAADGHRTETVSTHMLSEERERIVLAAALRALAGE